MKHFITLSFDSITMENMAILKIPQIKLMKNYSVISARVETQLKKYQITTNLAIFIF